MTRSRPARADGLEQLRRRRGCCRAQASARCGRRLEGQPVLAGGEDVPDGVEAAREPRAMARALAASSRSLPCCRPKRMMPSTARYPCSGVRAAPQDAVHELAVGDREEVTFSERVSRDLIRGLRFDGCWWTGYGRDGCAAAGRSRPRVGGSSVLRGRGSRRGG